MRVGILTLPLHSNYGGILQAFALQNSLEGLGHTVQIINKKPDVSFLVFKSLALLPIRFIKRFILHQSISLIPEIRYTQSIHTDPQFDQSRTFYTQQFIDRHLNIRNIKRFREIRKQDYDAFVVGSDQVWRKQYFEYLCGSTIDNAFLSFTKKWEVRRISYSASFGTDVLELNDKETKQCGQLLSLFESISVRESTGIELISRYFRQKATCVVDPTLLLDKEYYNSLIPKTIGVESTGGLFVYILDKNDRSNSICDSLIKKTGLTGNVFGASSNWPSVEEWLNCFRTASLVLTDSFHACIYSIIFEKPFFVIENNTRGLSRIHSLLTHFNLEDRLIKRPSLDSINESSIDFKSVNEILRIDRKHATAFLSIIG